MSSIVYDTQTRWLFSSVPMAQTQPAVPVISPLVIDIIAILVILLLVIGGGALMSALVTIVSRFLSHNAPSTAAMAAFAASESARLESTRTRNKMEKAKNTSETGEAEDSELEDEVDSSSDHIYALVGKYSRYVALLAAWIATCGSLFFSEVLGWIPCLLCWYQRILMYPLALILAVGLLRRDKGLHKYALVLSIPGACVSLFHYLYQKTELFSGMVPCTIGVPCSSDYLNWFGGVVTIPFLALIAFLIITFCMVASRLGASADAEREEYEQGAEADKPSRLATSLPVFTIIAVVVLAFVVAGAYVKNAVAASVPVSTPITTNPATTAVADPATLARGKAIFDKTCAPCHGANGQGTAAGLRLTTSQLVKQGNDADLAKFVRAGRSAQDPHNVTKQAMPASGGRTDISDQDLAATIAYLRNLARNAGKSTE